MLSPNEIEALPKPLEKQFRNLENRIMADIVRRLKKANEMTSGSEYQVERLLNLGVSQKDIERLIGNILEISQNEVSKIYDDIIAKGYARGLNLVKSAGGDIAPYKENKSLQQLISAVKSQTNKSFKNITQSLGFAVNQNGKTVFRPIADYYQKTLDSAVLDITTGAFDYNTVLKRIVNEMVNSGLRSVDYASGHSDRVEVAARRAVMTGVNQVTAKVAEQNMDALDTEYVEVSWHSGARPSHQVWQGKIYHWDRGNNHRNPQSSVDNSDKSSIIDSGGKITDSNFTQIEKFEKQTKSFYKACMLNNDDVKAIAQNTDFDYNDILAIKNHIMIQEHLFSDGSMRKFDPDIDQALAWQRLMEGRAKNTDILFLNHELRELKYMKETGCDYETAHAFSSKKYDWQTEIEKIVDKDNINPKWLK